MRVGEDFFESWGSAPEDGINADGKPGPGGRGVGHERLAEIGHGVGAGEEADARVGEEFLPIVQVKDDPEAFEVADQEV